MTRKPILVLLFLVIASLACSVFMGGPELPTPQPPSSNQPPLSLESEVERAIAESVTTGTVTMHFTEEQLTAFLAARLDSQDPPLIADPRVVLADQQLIIYGHARTGMIEANLAVTTEFSVDQQGVPQIRISHAELGPLPMPQALQDAIAAMIDEALTGPVGPAAVGFRLETVDISDGIMTITGRVR